VVEGRALIGIELEGKLERDLGLPPVAQPLEVHVDLGGEGRQNEVLRHFRVKRHDG
jgi:hypothetical protein